ncbi:hypothetical protein [Ancylobacter amanitiformis]|uniref:Uncharacterized protein n=1 Tax=Ancylobacter amanitiformis TaxID=217069 RepID=A0ABU0LPL0_9HYPH|nr:hypothetical protein [Ancylobacter amanitiformis]MDQ0510632.1 hypothetical protein [Ancylobacter amanitiformis]
MTDATPTHAPTSPILATLRFGVHAIRATRHPAHGRMLMAQDVLLAIGYVPKPPHGTRPILAGLKVADANRLLLKGEDFDASEGRQAPTFSKAIFLTRAGLDQLVANAAAKKVKTFGPWMADVMENGAPKRKPKPVPAVTPEVPPEGLPWEE